MLRSPVRTLSTCWPGLPHLANEDSSEKVEKSVTCDLGWMNLQVQNMALLCLPYRENLLNMRFAKANVIRIQANW